MPAYNAAKFIERAIGSILGQSFRDFELVIVNDGSTDHTMQVIRRFNDKRIVVVEQEHRGIACALNKGLQVTRSNLVARFDADDICQPERLRIQFDFMQTNPAYIICGSDVDYIDMHEEFVFSYAAPAYSNEQIQQLDFDICPFIHSTVMFRKKEVLETGGYSANAVSFEDHFLWRVLLKKGKARNLKISLIQVRLNPQSITIDERWRKKRFREIKYNALKNERLTEAEGMELRLIVQEQDVSKIKQGAYYALLGKKYLWNNYHPVKARKNIRAALSFNPADGFSYFLWMLSFMPRGLIRRIYRLSRSSKHNAAV